MAARGALFANATTLECVATWSERPDVGQAEWRALAERVSAEDRHVYVRLGGEAEVTVLAHAVFPDERPRLDFVIVFEEHSRAALRVDPRVDRVAAPSRCTIDVASSRFMSQSLFGFALVLSLAYVLGLLYSCSSKLVAHSSPMRVSANA